MSDRALNVDWAHVLRLNWERQVSRGYVWQYQAARFVVPLESTVVLEFLVGSQPTVIERLVLEIDASVYFEWFDGGAVTPGEAVVGQPWNRSFTRTAPLARASLGATVDTPGTSFGDPTVADRLILDADEQYYLAVTNEEIVGTQVTVSVYAALAADMEGRD